MKQNAVVSVDEAIHAGAEALEALAAAAGLHIDYPKDRSHAHAFRAALRRVGASSTALKAALPRAEALEALAEVTAQTLPFQSANDFANLRAALRRVKEAK